jgi:hypothetical protein
LRDLLSDLLGQKVSVVPAADQQLSPQRPAFGAIYRRDDDSVAAALVADLALTAAWGAAIGMMGADAVDQVLENGALDDDTAEFAREVTNVIAKLLNSPTTPHVVLRDVVTLPGEVPADTAPVLLEPAIRADLGIDVTGYAAGTATLLLR